MGRQRVTGDDQRDARHGGEDAEPRDDRRLLEAEEGREDAWHMQSDARSSSSGSVTTVYVTPDVWARAIPAGDALPTEKMKWSTHDDVRQRRADVVDCCGERERRIGEDNAVHRPTRQEVGDGGWERVRGTTSPSASTATTSVSSPAGNVHGADGMSHSVGRWWPTAGRSRRDKGPARYHDEHWTSRRRRGGNTRVPSGRRTDVRDKDERDRCLRSVVDEERLVDTDVCADGARAGRTAKISVSSSENVASEHGGTPEREPVFEAQFWGGLP